MNRKRSLLRAGAVLGVALAAGHVVQTMNSDAPPEQVAAAGMPDNIELTAAGAEAPVPAPATAAMLPLPQAGTIELAALTDDAPRATPPVASAPTLPVVPVTPPVAASPDCTPDLALTAGPQAMLSVTLTAPCAADKRVVLRHAGLTVAEKLDAKGQLLLDLPALDIKGEVSVLLPDAEIISAALPMPAVANLRRLAVQWMGDDTFQLSAYEGGAAYGGPASVSVDIPVSGNGGYLVALGNPGLDLPMMAQVYTWPATTRADPVIESTVTDMTCDRELLGETLLSEQGRTTISELTLAMPACDALGDILVLNNLVPQTTVTAQN